jgi:hypothetical protein
MAMTAGGGYGGGSYSYTVTYTLEEAVEKATTGLLGPDWVYGRLPASVQTELDRLATHRFSQRFSALGLADQKATMRTLLTEIRNAKNKEAAPSSLLDALTFARDGLAEPGKLYTLLPVELQAVLDGIAQEKGAPGFATAGHSQQIEILDFIIGSMNEHAEREAKQKAEEEAKRRAVEEARRKAEQEAKQKAAEEAKRKAEEETRIRAEQEAKRKAKEEAKRQAAEEARRQAEEAAKRRAEEKAKRLAQEKAKRQAEISATRKNAKQCILCGAPLGLLNRLLRREAHPTCVEWKE